MYLKNESLLKVTTLLILYVSESCEQSDEIFHIHLWTNPKHAPFTYFKNGQKYFTEKKCFFQNCYISETISHSDDITSYDAILFNAVTLRKTPSHKLPEVRAEHQKYILVSTKSSTAYPIAAKYNNYFNWTWTYKLDSDINFAYIAVRDKNDNLIGPNQEMFWMDNESMKSTSKNIIKKFKHKSKAAAWITSSCDTLTQYGKYIKKLKKELHKHKQVVDIFGPCGNKKCSHNKMKNCLKLLELKYYFYLAFEDSIAEDYVTKQLLTALHHYTVPVVFGGANYSRFMPNGMYLNALELGPTKLGKEMHKIISNKESYYDMFKWHRYYSFHNPLRNPETNGVCELCAKLNDEYERDKLSAYSNIVKWFNDRKDWDIWKTRRDNGLDLFHNQTKRKKSNKKHAVHNLSANRDDDKNVHDNVKNGCHNKSIIDLLDDDADDDGEIIARDENNLYINDFVTVIYDNS